MDDLAARSEQLRALLDEVRGGNVEGVRRLVGEDPSLAAARDASGVSVLMLALYHGHAQLAAWLAEHGPGCDVFEAAALGDVRRVRDLVAGEPVLLSASSADGFGALALASFFGRLEVVSLLLGLGADVNAIARMAPGYTPLTGAVTSRHTAVVAELLRHGADVNYRYGPGYSALHAAGANGGADIVELLLGAGADALARSDDGKTPADIAREKGHVEVAARLSGAGPAR